ncbi:MAG: pyridoxamine 5'-phosphate oxidase family protein [Deferribacteraceae bacterium]|jgi:general stress protein 26|nr:pyridoxamine 5'-phosphate oxidase family protein [Deferribacteraceae bacterium]
MKEKNIELIETAPTVYLSTIDERGYPNTRAMLNLQNKLLFPSLIPLFNGRDLHFTTNFASQKITDILSNNLASAYFCIPELWHGMMVQGKIEIVEDVKLRHSIWQRGWETYYPDGVDSIDYVVLRLKTEKMSSYYQYRRFDIEF